MPRPGVTVTRGYQNNVIHREYWIDDHGGGLVAKWVPVPKPAAQLTAVDPTPVLEPDGRTSQVFLTATGKRFVEVVEPTGFVLWLQEVTS